MVTRPTDVTEALLANPAMSAAPTTSGAVVEWDADRAVTAIYSEHYRSLVRLAAFLVRDNATAEEVVQDSFVAMHGAWRRLRDTDKALSYLRQTVVNRSRAVLRHRVVVDMVATSEISVSFTTDRRAPGRPADRAGPAIPPVPGPHGARSPRGTCGSSPRPG